MHVGTFTDAGTYAAAAERLPELRDLGVTVIELMPLAEFPGRFGWGYDGVDLWAPTRLYGRPDDLRRFIDAAHRLGIGVILDVVYNHVGPDGNYLARFSSDYFSRPVLERMGRSAELRRRQLRPGARAVPRERGVLDRRVPLRRPAAGRDPADLRRLARAPGVGGRAPRARGGRRSRHVPGRGERDAGREAGAPREPRRLRPRRALERRLPPQRGGGADRPQRSLLLRPSRPRAGAGVGDPLGIPVPGPALFLAEKAARHGRAGSRRAELRALHREPRSGRERLRHAAGVDGRARRPAGADRAHAAGAGDADAVPGAGVGLDTAVPLFRRS